MVNVIDDRRKVVEETRFTRARIDAVNTSTTSRARTISENIETYYGEIRSEIEKLIEQKHEILSGPRTPADTVALAKAELMRLRKKHLLEEVLLKHLEDIQKGGSPFDPTTLRVYFDVDSKRWRLFYTAFDEADIDELSTRLPDIGMSQTDKQMAVEKIDKKIAQLENKLKEDVPQNVLLKK